MADEKRTDEKGVIPSKRSETARADLARAVLARMVNADPMITLSCRVRELSTAANVTHFRAEWEDSNGETQKLNAHVINDALREPLTINEGNYIISGFLTFPRCLVVTSASAT